MTPRSGPPADPPAEVVVSGEIRLGQFLKLADLAGSGAVAKTAVADGLVTVNNEVEVRRGRQLAPGDVVRLADRVAVVAPVVPD